jgi:hypothetical protein
MPASKKQKRPSFSRLGLNFAKKHTYLFLTFATQLSNRPVLGMTLSPFQARAIGPF